MPPNTINHDSGRLQARRDQRRQSFDQQRVRVRNLVLYSMDSEGDEEDTFDTPTFAIGPFRSESHRRAETMRASPPREVNSSLSHSDEVLVSNVNAASMQDKDESVSRPVSICSLAEVEDCQSSVAADQDSLGSIAYTKRDNYRFGVHIDREQYDRACEIPLFSTKRPYMRAFHFAWASFFVAFFAWFAITPLLSEIQYSLDLTKQEIWTSSILALVASALTRIVAGPLNDKYGPRYVMSAALVMTAIPTGLAGWIIQDASSLYWTRFMIGVAGSTFVGCQAWINSMFTVEVAGTAQALTAGWANLAGGLSQLFMGSLLFPLFKVIYGGEGYNQVTTESDHSDHETAANDHAAELAWRTILVFPAIMCLAMAYAVVRYSDDSPRGNVVTLRKEGALEPVSAMDSLWVAASDWNTWILAAQYGCCFGVEVAFTQAGCLYFREVFGQTTESAAAIASSFGWMNIFARAIGGFASDLSNVRYGMRGRLWTQVLFFLVEGALVIAFAHTKSLVGAVFVLILLSMFVSASAGSTFAIVPYVHYSVTGSITGLVGAGGSACGIFYTVLFLKFDYQEAFLWMGCSVLGSTLLTAFLSIRGYRGLLTGEDSLEVQRARRTAELPEEIIIPTPVCP